MCFQGLWASPWSPGRGSEMSDVSNFPGMRNGFPFAIPALPTDASGAPFSWNEYPVVSLAWAVAFYWRVKKWKMTNFSMTVIDNSEVATKYGYPTSPFNAEGQQINGTFTASSVDQIVKRPDAILDERKLITGGDNWASPFSGVGIMVRDFDHMDEEGRVPFKYVDLDPSGDNHIASTGVDGSPYYSDLEGDFGVGVGFFLDPPYFYLNPSGEIVFTGVMVYGSGGVASRSAGGAVDNAESVRFCAPDITELITSTSTRLESRTAAQSAGSITYIIDGFDPVIVPVYYSAAAYLQAEYMTLADFAGTFALVPIGLSPSSIAVSATFTPDAYWPYGGKWDADSGAWAG